MTSISDCLCDHCRGRDRTHRAHRVFRLCPLWLEEGAAPIHPRSTHGPSSWPLFAPLPHTHSLQPTRPHNGQSLTSHQRSIASVQADASGINVDGKRESQSLIVWKRFIVPSPAVVCVNSYHGSIYPATLAPCFSAPALRRYAATALPPSPSPPPMPSPVTAVAALLGILRRP